MSLSPSRRRPAWIFALCLAIAAGSAAPSPSFATEAPPWYESRTRPDLPSDFLLGLEVAEAFSRHFGLVETDSLVERVNDIGYALAHASGRPDILFTFQVLDVEEPNALALPGGWILVTRGILETGLTDAELAHLLGHEIVHVTRSHFSRQGRMNGLLSLLQMATFVAVSIAASESGPSRPVIEDPGSYGYPQSSQEAALRGTAVFGSLFHELLMRGYSRKLEVEADEGGRRLASLAGYPREAGTLLLEKLHSRIYEDREFGYWRTHPYFTDRVSAARAAGTGRDFPPSADALAAYRTGIRDGLVRAAGRVRSEPRSDYLYGLALHAAPSGGSGTDVRAEILRHRLRRLERGSDLLRPYGPLLADCDSLLARLDRSPGDTAAIAMIRTVRDSVDAARLRLLPRYEEAIAQPSTSAQILDAFLANFPLHERADAMRLRLGISYQLSERYDLAVERLGELLTRSESGASPPDSASHALAKETLLKALPKVEEPAVGQRLLQIQDPNVREAAFDRLVAIAADATQIEKVGKFAQSFPDSPAAEQYRDRLETLAEAELKKGRLHEGLGDHQSALNTYNKILILAPRTRSAADARLGIGRIQTLASSEDGR